MLFFIAILLIFLIGYCFALVENHNAKCVVELTFAITDFLMPFVVLRALRQDSKFWQGLYENAVRQRARRTPALARYRAQRGASVTRILLINSPYAVGCHFER